jgi:hypothetical protein
VDGEARFALLGANTRKPIETLEPREKAGADRGFPSTALRAGIGRLQLPPASKILVVKILCRACRGAKFSQARLELLETAGRNPCITAISLGAPAAPFTLLQCPTRFQLTRQGNLQDVPDRLGQFRRTQFLFRRSLDRRSDRLLRSEIPNL